MYTGGSSVGSCSPCTGGYYCAVPGLSAPTGLCLEGYYCPDEANVTTATPALYICPPGRGLMVIPDMILEMAY